MSVRSVAYAASGGASSPTTGGVRIHNSNRGGPAVSALKVVGTAGFPRNQVEFDPMCLVQQRRNRLAFLVFGAVFDDVHADRTTGQHRMGLLGSDGQRGKRPALVLARRLVANRFGGPSFACEHRM